MERVERTERIEHTGRPGDIPAVELIAVRKAYGSAEALAGIDLRIEGGEVVAVLGPNGAGKTTAISLMLGIRQPTAGDVRIFGFGPGDPRARSLRGAMLQDSGVPGVLTVREVIELFRTYYPEPLPVETTLALAGLSEQARKKVGQLSGGQRQRLYFALAICGDPEALFLDEPTVAMDVASRRAFLATILEFAERGRTIVLTTHDMDEADQLAKRVIVIDRGTLVADDTPTRIKARVPGRRVSFRTESALAPATLAGLPISHLAVDGGLTRFLTNRPEAVLAALFARGVQPADLEVVGADLEEAFLALTSQQVLA
jgi:ABC-2 type transport system ATP-binding protein